MVEEHDSHSRGHQVAQRAIDNDNVGTPFKQSLQCEPLSWRAGEGNRPSNQVEQ
jgi:hypothetical protein